MSTYRRLLAAGGALLLLAATLIFMSPAAKAQTSSATLDGTVFDASGAVVPVADSAPNFAAGLILQCDGGAGDKIGRASCRERV